MWNPFRKKHLPEEPKLKKAPLRFFNTLGASLQTFDPPEIRAVRMYNCGPTVYDVQHIGNLSMFVFADVLRRALEHNGLEVKQVINITDFGHLSGDNQGDADTGEDRMTKGLKREGMELTLANMRTLAERYAARFVDDLRILGLPVDKTLFPRASDYIPAQIAMVRTLEEKGYAYETADGVYFDTYRFPHYGELGGIDLSSLKEGARVAVNAEKRNPTDFALWKKDAKLGWKSPWGLGFPGWHIECSAMIRSILGEQIDIHTGGIEHIAIHHNNEIAQSEAASGKRPLSRFWLHRAHIQLEGAKFAKSEHRVIYLSDIIQRGFHPLSYRYLLLGAHYRTPMNFTWEALTAAQSAFLRLHKIRNTLPHESEGTAPPPYIERFNERINDDLDTPGALAVLWDMLQDESIPPQDLYAGIVEIDKVFGLGLDKTDELAQKMIQERDGVELAMEDIPQDMQKKIKEREEARASRDWPRADLLRSEIESAGYRLEDKNGGVRVYKV